MATIHHEPVTSTITSDALGILDCFSGGFEDVLYQMAEHSAVDRTGQRRDVEISVADIEDGARRLVQALEKSDLPTDVKAAVSSMLRCMADKVGK